MRRRESGEGRRDAGVGGADTGMTVEFDNASAAAKGENGGASVFTNRDDSYGGRRLLRVPEPMR